MGLSNQLVGSLLAFAWLLLTPVAAAQAPAPSMVTGVLADGTRFATRLYVVDSGLPGPKVLVVAGVHGNERAPPVAATRILDWPLTKGTLVVVPRANRLALAARSRHTSRTRWLDLNRCFPTKDGQRPDGALAQALWQLTVDFGPDWVLDLHEGYGFNVLDQKTMGSSVVYVTGARAETLARRVQGAVNATIERPYRKFTVLSPGPRASFARSVTERLGIPSLVLETTWTTQPLERRVTQQLSMVRTVLGNLGMLPADGGDDA